MGANKLNIWIYLEMEKSDMHGALSQISEQKSTNSAPSAICYNTTPSY